MARAFSIDVITLFPSMLKGPFSRGPVARAQARGLVRLYAWDLREFTRDPHRKVDDVPFGGGRGMVLMAEPLVRAAEHVLEIRRGRALGVLVMSAAGELFHQAMARELSGGDGIVVLCGRYEGMDARVPQILGAREVSVGDYVLSGGEIPAMAVIDAVVRLLPGAVGHERSVAEESFGDASELTAGLLEYPHYTRPRVFRGLSVPEVLLSGNHQAVARWRRERALEITLRRRAHLLATAPLSPEEREMLQRWQVQLSGPGRP